MVKQTRVEKYRKLRREIDKMSDKSLEELAIEDKEKKKNIVKNSVRHSDLEENSNIKTATLTMPIEELLEGHAEYVGERKRLEDEKKKKRKHQFKIGGFTLLSISLLVVLILVIVYISR